MDMIPLPLVLISIFIFSFAAAKQLMWSGKMCKLSWAFAVLLIGASSAWAQSPLKVGDVLPYHAESPHPYPIGGPERITVWQEVVQSPGAEFLRLRFRGFALAPGDYVTVSNPDGSDFWVYKGRGPHGNGEFWSFAIQGEVAIVEIHAGPRNDHGYRIDAIGHGTVDLGRPLPTPEVICGTNGLEDIACYQSNPDIKSNEARPVARLLFKSGGGFFLCTGWLVDGSNDNTLMTNNHCISKKREVTTLQATFNFQKIACSGASEETPTDYNGGVLLKTNSVSFLRGKGGLDYTLLTLQENPEATWGELSPTSNKGNVGDRIWFIQHPGGGVKKIGYWEDSAQTIRCKVDAIERTYLPSSPSSQSAYACDSQGGSSGSPIIHELTGKVIALHHFGGVENCLNSGTAMADICADAGQLLNCGDSGVCLLLPKGEPCISGSECCSGKCKGKSGAKSCK